MSGVAARTARALRRSNNWVQLGKFGAVGLTGTAVNLVVFALLVKKASLGAHEAAVISFAAAAVNNYWWNRHWTFAREKGHFGQQGLRFTIVSLVVLGVNQLWLLVFVDWLGWDKIVAQAVAIVLVTPLNFLGNKLWSFRR